MRDRQKDRKTSSLKMRDRQKDRKAERQTNRYTPKTLEISEVRTYAIKLLTKR